MQFLKKAAKVAMMGLVLPSMVGASLYAGTLVTVGGVEVPDKILEIFQKADPSFNYSALPLSLIHISEPTRQYATSRMPSSA